MINELPSGWFSNDDVQVYRRLASQVPEHGVIAELGVWKGRSLCSIADIIVGRKLSVIAVDTFEGVPKVADANYREATVRNIQQQFMDNTIRFGLGHTVVHKLTTNLASARFVLSKFDLIFIDADHRYESVRDDILSWYPLLKVGGIIAGHDVDEVGVTGAIYRVFDGTHEEGARIWWKVKT